MTMSENQTVTPVFTATTTSLILVAPSSLTFGAQVVNTAERVSAGDRFRAGELSLERDL